MFDVKLPINWIRTEHQFISEINPKLINKLYEDLDVTFLPMANVSEKNGKFDLSIVKRFSEVKKGFTNFKDNDILFAKITPCMENGKIALVNNLRNGIGFGSTEFHVSRPCEIVSPRFIFYYLNQDVIRKNARNNMTGTAGQLRVSSDYFKKIQIPLPPLPEQRAIVSKIEQLFSELDNGIESLKKAKEQIKVYRQAVLRKAFEGELTREWREKEGCNLKQYSISEMIQTGLKKEYNMRMEEWKQKIKKWEASGKSGKKPAKPSEPKELAPLTENELNELPELPEGWEWRFLKEICSTIFDGPFGTNLMSKDYTSNGVRVIRLENVGTLEFKDNFKTFVSEEKYKTIDNHTVYNGDIIFSSFIGEQIRVCILPSFIDKAINKADCFCVRCNDKISSAKYICYYLSTLDAYHKLANEIHGATRPRINTKQLSLCKIPVPSLPEQNQIVQEIETRFSVCDNMEKNIDEALQKADALRQSILKKAFDGRLLTDDELESARKEPDWEPAEKLLERIKKEKSR